MKKLMAQYPLLAFLGMENLFSWIILTRNQCPLLHTTVNASGGFVQPLLPSSPFMDWIPVIAYGGCAILLILWTRGKLGER